MKKELTEVYCGKAKGKTTLALGQSLRAAADGKSVIIIQFLKGKERRSMDFLEELDQLDIKIFRFEKRNFYKKIKSFAQFYRIYIIERKKGDGLHDDSGGNAVHRTPDAEPLCDFE